MQMGNFQPLKISWIYELTLQQTNISHFEDDFPFPKVGYVNSLEGIPYHKGEPIRRLQVPWVQNVVAPSSAGGRCSAPVGPGERLGF